MTWDYSHLSSRNLVCSRLEKATTNTYTLYLAGTKPAGEGGGPDWGETSTGEGEEQHRGEETCKGLSVQDSRTSTT
jgi:hypothetical protein